MYYTDMKPNSLCFSRFLFIWLAGAWAPWDRSYPLPNMKEHINKLSMELTNHFAKLAEGFMAKWL